MTGRHTYIVTAVTSSSALVLFIGLVILYKTLKPISSQIHDITVINATSKLPVFENDNNTPGDQCSSILFHVMFTFTISIYFPLCAGPEAVDFEDVWIETPL